MASSRSYLAAPRGSWMAEAVLTAERADIQTGKSLDTKLLT